MPISNITFFLERKNRVIGKKNKGKRGKEEGKGGQNVIIFIYKKKYRAIGKKNRGQKGKRRAKT